MSTKLERIYDALPVRQRILLAWAATGAGVYAALPALHSATTVVGPAALWFWLLPLAALGLDLLLSADTEDTGTTLHGSPASLRRRQARRPRLSRRVRPRQGVPPGRQADSA